MNLILGQAIARFFSVFIHLVGRKVMSRHGVIIIKKTFCLNLKGKDTFC